MFLKKAFQLSIVLALSLGASVFAGDKLSICDDLFQTGQIETALKCYRDAYKQAPDNPLINLRICRLLEASGQVDKIAPYIGKIDQATDEARKFRDYLATHYRTLQIELSGKVDCPLYFAGAITAKITAPADLAPGQAARLDAINSSLDHGKLLFRKESEGKSIAKLHYFPILTSVPLPYSIKIGEATHSFNFNFIQQEKLVLNPEDFESLYCRVPSNLTEIRVAIDDPDYDISLAETGKADSTAFEFKDGRYYVSNEAAPTLRYQKKNRQLLNKNYFIITSTILTITVLLFQR